MTKPVTTQTSDAIRVRSLPEGGYVISVQDAREGFRDRDVVAMNDIEGVRDWIESSAQDGGFVCYV